MSASGLGWRERRDFLPVLGRDNDARPRGKLPAESAAATHASTDSRSRLNLQVPARHQVRSVSLSRLNHRHWRPDSPGSMSVTLAGHWIAVARFLPASSTSTAAFPSRCLLLGRHPVLTKIVSLALWSSLSPPTPHSHHPLNVQTSARTKASIDTNLCLSPSSCLLPPRECAVRGLVTHPPSPVPSLEIPSGRRATPSAVGFVEGAWIRPEMAHTSPSPVP